MERVHAVFERESNVRELVKMGVLLQVNTGSLMGGAFDRRSARLRKYIEANLIHFLGSDCHNLKERPPMMKNCVEKLYKKLPEACVDRLLYENRQSLLKDK